MDQPGGGTSKKVCTLNVKVIDLVHPVRDLRFAFQGGRLLCSWSSAESSISVQRVTFVCDNFQGDCCVPGLRQSLQFSLSSA